MSKQANKTTVSYSVNQYDIEMLTILEPEKRPVFISLKKALAILGTNDNADAISEVQKHGKTMYSIMYPDGKKFTVGIRKINAVLNAEQEIVLGLHASIDSAKEA